MNEKARKKARQAELESIMIDAWKFSGLQQTFSIWLEQTIDDEYAVWQAEAKELIALYEWE